MGFPLNKTKIVCTIGPASDSTEVMEKMLLAGMNVARLNFSHGDFSSHGKVIKDLRAASQSAGQRVAIMADLPGPKMRIGELAKEPIELKAGDDFVLTTDEITGDAHRVSVSFHRLPQAVKPGDALYLNDGYIQVEATKVDANDVHTRVLVGGELRSRKGLNLPGIDLGIRAFTEHDKACMQFALDHGVDAVSQSFVENEGDILSVREAADKLGHKPFIIAKIERSRAQAHLDAILDAADGIMIARGDLGVEIPIERIALAQKYLMRRANIHGKPVITATQMLESMTTNPRPTRAEATDVANAILDGTDGVMLSGESALGKYPVESVEMLSKIAAAIEPHRPSYQVRELLKSMAQKGDARPVDIISYSVEAALNHIFPAAVFVPTRSGLSARRITRFRLPVWIVAVSSLQSTCQALQFSYGVFPVWEPDHPEDWKRYVSNWLKSQGVEGDTVLLTEGPSAKHPEANNRMEILELRNER